MKNQRTRSERLARFANVDLRDRLQSMYYVEENADTRFDDLLEKLNDASSKAEALSEQRAKFYR